jgi:hypothetical protein
VAVRFERARGKVDLCALEAGRARPEPDRIGSPAAGSFKTIDIEAA